LLPTFIEAVDLQVPTGRLEGHSLMPIINNEIENNLRNTVFSELDYGCYPVSDKLNINVNDARIFMIRNHKWKYIYYKGFDAQLFDLENDPNEFNDLGTSSTHSDIRKTMKDLLLDRLISRKNRVTQEDDVYAEMKRDDNKKGIIIGRW